jgi:glucuronate isomerase
MVPSFRPDRALAIDDIVTWKAYIARLGASANVSIETYQDLDARRWTSATPPSTTWVAGPPTMA